MSIINRSYCEVHQIHLITKAIQNMHLYIYIYTNRAVIVNWHKLKYKKVKQTEQLLYPSMFLNMHVKKIFYSKEFVIKINSVFNLCGINKVKNEFYSNMIPFQPPC